MTERAGTAETVMEPDAPEASDLAEPPGPDDRTVPAPPWAVARERRPRRIDRAPLDRERIVAAGLRVVDAEGVDALSVRRLAADLDVAPMSLYWHVRDKAQLLDLVGEAVLGEIDVPGRSPDWKEDLRDVHRAMRTTLDRHPNTADLMIGRARYGRAGLALFERILATLLGAGFDPDSAFAAYDALYLFTLGYAATASRTPEFVAMQLEGIRYLQSLPARTFPSITTVAPTILRRPPGARFETGLDVLLEGIARRLGPDARTSTAPTSS